MKRGGTIPRTASPHTARLINDRLAFDLLLERGPLTRTQLRTLTGLSGPTVADLVQRLESAGLVAPVGEAGAERRGPNARLYGVVADRAHVAGVEVRPDQVRAVVTDLTGQPVGTAVVAQDARVTPDRLVCRALDGALADAGRPADSPAMVVVGTPGLVDPVTGDVAFVVSLPTWHGNLLPGLRERFGTRVLLENEVNLVGLAEHRLGVARGRDTFALLSLGDGIGVAVVLGGRLHRGASGGAGEVSYVPADGGTYQRVAGGAAVVETARRHGLAGSVDDLAGLVGGAVARAGEDHDTAAEAFLDDLADRISTGAAAVCAVLDPGYVVLAGAVGRAGGPALADRVARRLADRLPLPTEVAASDVSGNPVVRGAVLVALDHLHRETFGLTGTR
ncbi:ROK family protein [Actinopolymorpha singaporensis]|uniref:Sugar kinase of the NBD/HSP70 family, may contain an N-terminal HTH domain n=1 Tax=Actinopolymorpha singaporensis TaxID=117157 RepID=A0A1H1U9I5_9ACTN|nr:ROK family transcriptional regulator [Actinopolymorpha singaporensis]SDS69057.1 Sugar kinase of the NBD/HSP70 family, may contain an N-terminal HTH domain [Actinopolymorpha singaporensis]